MSQVRSTFVSAIRPCLFRFFCFEVFGFACGSVFDLLIRCPF